MIAALPRLSAQAKQPGPYVAVQGLAYTPSLMLDTAEWARIAALYSPDLFVAVPADDLLVFGSIAQGKALDAAHKGARSSFKTAERGISPLVYRRRGDRWVVAD